MKDPREKKLPKWAQELLREERLKNALRFPDETCPEHDFWPRDTTLPQVAQGRFIYSENAAGVRRHFVGSHGHLYRDASCSGVGSRAQGAYYLRLEDARLAHRWRLARIYAEKLLAAETAEPRS